MIRLHMIPRTARTYCFRNTELIANANGQCRTQLRGYIRAARKTHFLALGGEHDASTGAAADRRALRRTLLADKDSTDDRAGECTDADLGGVLTLRRRRLAGERHCRQPVA